MVALYRRFAPFAERPPAHACRLPQRRPSAGVCQQSCAVAASEIKLSSPAPVPKRSPLQSCQEGVDGEREQTLWSGFWALNGAAQNNIISGRFRLLSFSCPSPPGLLSYPLCQRVSLSLDLKIIFNQRCYIAFRFSHAVRLQISSLFSHWFFQISIKAI